MLTPAPPIKGDPLYREKMDQYRKDRTEKRQNPEGWGVVRGDEPAGDEPAGDEQAE